MKGFVQDIENEAFRRVLYTAKRCLLVVMQSKSKEDRSGGPQARPVLSRWGEKG